MWKFSIIALMLVSVAAGETVHLSDGTTVTGKIYRDGGGWKLVLPNGMTRSLSGDQVISIDLSSASANNDNLADQLASLRHSLEFTDDAVQAVARVENFIHHNPNTPAATKAQKDLAIWQDRENRHLVKISDDWLTPEAVGELRAQAVLITDHARQLIRNGDVAGATKLVNQVVAIDPHSAPGLYLQGVLACNTNRLALAEKDFRAEAEITPHHGPTLNNLAVLSFHTQHYAQAAGLYLQAMRSDPLARPIVDNVAEFLHAIPREVMELPTLRLLKEEFVRQDGELQRLLAKQNLSRWGAKWVTSNQLQAILLKEKSIDQQLSELNDELGRDRATMNDYDQQISNNDQKEQTMASSSYAVNPTTGQMVAVGYPQAYYDLEKDNADLKRRRDLVAGQAGGIVLQITATQRKLPLQPFDGVQQIIGEEGTPISAPARAATQSATTKPAGSVEQSGAVAP